MELRLTHADMEAWLTNFFYDDHRISQPKQMPLKESNLISGQITTTDVYSYPRQMRTGYLPLSGGGIFIVSRQCVLFLHRASHRIDL